MTERRVLVIFLNGVGLIEFSEFAGHFSHGGGPVSQGSVLSSTGTEDKEKEQADSSSNIEANTEVELALKEKTPLRPLTSLTWPYVPEESAYPDPLKRDDPKPLQLKQYETIGACMTRLHSHAPSGVDCGKVTDVRFCFLAPLMGRIGPRTLVMLTIWRAPDGNSNITRGQEGVGSSSWIERLAAED